MRWTLVEANERKAMFLDEAARALSLENVTVVRSRYEDVEPSAAFDVVTLRGVSVAQKTLDKLGSELRPGGRLLWMSSEALLAAGREALAQNDAWARCTGPIPLLSGGGFLLVVDVRA